MAKPQQRRQLQFRQICCVCGVRVCCTSYNLFVRMRHSVGFCFFISSTQTAVVRSQKLQPPRHARSHDGGPECKSQVRSSGHT